MRIGIVDDWFAPSLKQNRYLWAVGDSFAAAFGRSRGLGVVKLEIGKMRWIDVNNNPQKLLYLQRPAGHHKYLSDRLAKAVRRAAGIPGGLRALVGRLYLAPDKLNVKTKTKYEVTHSFKVK